MHTSCQLNRPVNPFQVTESMVHQFSRLFINRQSYAIQASKADESGGFPYFRQKSPLDRNAMAAHLKGRHTIAIYAINPQTQTSKWLAMDADYADALAHLRQLCDALWQDGIHAALENSRRGGHLWVFHEEPVPAALCRLYIYNIAARLHIPIKHGKQEGLEIFPRQDRLELGQFGNAIRAPLGVHRKVMERFWFTDADPTLAAQMDYLWQLPKVTEKRFLELTRDMTFPEEYKTPVAVHTGGPTGDPSQWFLITNYVPPLKRVGSSWKTRCPNCARWGHDQTGDNLVVTGYKYKCFAGCNKYEIREACGVPIKSSRVKKAP